LVSWRESGSAVRILKVVQAYYPFQEKGGPVVKVRALARGLVQGGHQVTVLTADLGLHNHRGAGVNFEACQWGLRSEQDGVEVIYLPTLAHYRALTLNPRLMRFCRASLGGFDLVHLYGLYELLGPTVGYYSRHQRIPYVIEPMGMYRPIIRNLRLKRIYHRLLGKTFVDGARFLVATSELERQELISAGIVPSRIVVRPNGIDFPERLPARGKFRREWNIPENAPVVLFLGRLVSKKSPDLLLEAFARWRKLSSLGRDSVLVLAGPDEKDGFVRDLKKMAKQLGLGENVRFTGPLYDEAKWGAYCDADVFVLPSQNENFGNTAAESAACGTPVIVTDRCGIASFVGRAGLVIAHDQAQLERALQQLLEDRALRERCHDGCAEMAKKLSWEGPLDQSKQLYERCIRNGPPNGLACES
jgi:glycosyltransferase involved in cell wall biosynthesis